MDPFLSKLLLLEQGLDQTVPSSKTQEYYQESEKKLLGDFKDQFCLKMYQDLDKKRKETFLLDCEKSSYLFCMHLWNKENLIDSSFLRKIAYVRYERTITVAQQIIIQKQMAGPLVECIKRD